jgi:hypothetical protein
MRLGCFALSLILDQLQSRGGRRAFLKRAVGNRRLESGYRRFRRWSKLPQTGRRLLLNGALFVSKGSDQRRNGDVRFDLDLDQYRCLLNNGVLYIGSKCTVVGNTLNPERFQVLARVARLPVRLSARAC